MAGDEVHAIYRLSGGAVAHFDSKRRAGSNPSRFGLRIYGSEAVIELSTGLFVGSTPGRSRKVK